MKKAPAHMIQAVEWKPGMPVSAGEFKAVVLIHCVEDGSITAHFPLGDEPRGFLAGDDFALDNVDITVTSGLFDINSN